MRVICFIRDQFGYDTGTTHVHSNLDEILNAGGGVCQDFAHLCARSAASGRRSRALRVGLHGVRPPGRTRALGEQASHAWIEALLPGMGWTGFDPTHRCRTDIRHIRVAVGRDYADASPIRGVYRSDASHNTMSVELEVLPAPTSAFNGQSQQ